MSEAPLELLAVSKWYGQVSALTDVSFRCGAGVTGLVGRNGAGKSTLIKLACGLLAPSQGEVRLHGEPPFQNAGARASLGLCADLDRCYEGLSGRVFVRWMLRLSGFSRREADERAVRWLTELGLREAMQRKIGGYSKGMRQRVKLAQALAHDPSVLLLDEPMTGLDPVARHEVSTLIRRLGAQGVTVVVSSHVLHELQTVAERVVLMHQGRVLADGGVSELRAQLEGRPSKLLLRSGAPRELAARLALLDVVASLEIVEGGLHVATHSGAGWHETLTRIGAEERSLIDEIVPLDDSLDAVFGYLVA